jgi:hypothetical protein
MSCSNRLVDLILKDVNQSVVNDCFKGIGDSVLDDYEMFQSALDEAQELLGRPVKLDEILDCPNIRSTDKPLVASLLLDGPPLPTGRITYPYRRDMFLLPPPIPARKTGLLDKLVQFFKRVL